MVLEYLAPGFIYSIMKDCWNYISRRRVARRKPEEVIRIRQRWKSEIEKELSERQQGKRQTDIIIRDMKRIDKYPDISEKEKGISAWFRAGLMGTYHRGILAGLKWEELVKEGDLWRRINYQKNESGGRTAMLIGRIPYEFIEAIDWDGDEYYGLPIIYCHFDSRSKEPYESLAYCEENHLNGFPFYTEIAPYIPSANTKKRYWLFGKAG